MVIRTVPQAENLMSDVESAAVTSAVLSLVPKLQFGNTYPRSSGFVMANTASGLFKVAITLRAMVIRTVPQVEKFEAGRGCSHFLSDWLAVLVVYTTGF